MPLKFDSALMTLVFILVLNACGSAHESKSSTLKSIIDQDSITAIGKDTVLPNEDIRQHLNAIGKMIGGCTVFHLGQGIVATAGHCLTAPKLPLESASCHQLSMTWGETLDTVAPAQSRCLKILDYRFDQSADYALLLVDPAPETSVILNRKPHDHEESTEALVIGYPKHKTLSLSGVCEARWTPSPDQQFFQHRCDTMPGNSGSPVVDAHTAAVIGIHNGDSGAKQNYGSFLPSTEQLEKLGAAISATKLEKPSELRFGPFADQLTQTLVQFTSQQGHSVSFKLNSDMENGYDKLIIIDGKSQVREWTGQQHVQLENLPTPVSVVVLTDYSGSSRAVELKAIRYH